MKLYTNLCDLSKKKILYRVQPPLDSLECEYSRRPRVHRELEVTVMLTKCVISSRLCDDVILVQSLPARTISNAHSGISWSIWMHYELITMLTS